MHNISISVSSDCTAFKPKASTVRYWANAALKTQSIPRSIDIHLIDDIESAALNFLYRKKNGPTNVLSFPLDFSLEIENNSNYLMPLGEIFICAPLVLKEAQEQGSTIGQHWAHLVIHGVLHLLGYDHEKEADAVKMEALEVKILHQLGYGNPYQIDHA